MDLETLMHSTQPFLEWLVAWYNGRPELDLGDMVGQAGGGDHVAVLAVDVTVGFCSQGALSSRRVGGIVGPIERLFRRTHALGVRKYLLPQDTHSADAVEFGSYPPHCVRGSQEPVTVPELMNLPFSGLFLVIEKDSLSSDIGTGLDDWLASHPEVVTYLVVGDCTDLCVHQLAMHLRLWFNARGRRGVRVIVPISGVDTFDLPIQDAEQVGALPHPGDLLHLVFLYNMAENGVEVVAGVV